MLGSEDFWRELRAYVEIWDEIWSLTWRGVDLRELEFYVWR